MRGLYFCIRTPRAGHAQTRAGAAHVSFIYIDKEGGKRAALFRAGLAEAEGRAEAGAESGRRARHGGKKKRRGKGKAAERRESYPARARGAAP